MDFSTAQDQFVQLGLTKQAAQELIVYLSENLPPNQEREQIWPLIANYLLAHEYPFDIHLYLFSCIFPHWLQQPETAPACIPKKETIAKTHLGRYMTELNIQDVKTFHDFTVTHYPDFWQHQIKNLGIVFKKQPDQLCDLSQGLESPNWLPGAKLNITDSCFTAPSSSTAIYYQDQKKNICQLSYGELHVLANRIANSMLAQGFKTGDAIAIAMPMTLEAVAIYLGIIKIGGIVVSIADSFSSEEIATRLKIANAKAIFTQDFSLWNGKKLPLYEKISAIHAKVTQPFKAIVLACEPPLTLSLQKEDLSYDHFLVDNTDFISLPCEPMAACNILFSSGTTAEPKAIVWNHTTLIKAASDAALHHNVQAHDIFAWPTNLGWMMGPWLIFATLINHAAMAIYTEAPRDRAFGQFIQDAKVTILGVVPTLVATWRQTKCMEKLDWQSINVLTSTGECSNPKDMLYLMWLAGYKPIIEYCGGTEIGGAYLTSTIIQNNYPSLFSTPAMGMAIKILDENGQYAKEGEVVIVPPSIGLSTALLNANHHQVYFADMPTLANGDILRRHGDAIKQLSNGYYLNLGRIDDAMKLGGIKTSAAEIERVLVGIPQIVEVAAVTIPAPDNGPSLLIIFAATSANLSKSEIMKEMQSRISTHLNPFFKIHDLIFKRELPKTASNKILRRLLKKEYQSSFTE